MTDIKVSTLSVPRVPRNKRIYSEYKTERISIGTPSEFVDTQRNIQANILSYDLGDFATRTITVDFQTPFLERPIGWVKTYRYEPRSGGGFFYTNAIHYVNSIDWLNELGFEIIVENYEALTGLFVEYSFVERIDDEE
jgi:hypothetical protein